MNSDANEAALSLAALNLAALNLAALDPSREGGRW